MKPVDLLDGPHLALLQGRLHEQLLTAPAHGLLSITLDFGLADDWLHSGLNSALTRAHAAYWARPKSADYRLALGCAMIFTTAGPARFSALQAAFAGLAPNWQHDDPDQTSIIPAAHLGFAFSETAEDNLPNARLVVPSILLQSHASRCTATFSCAVRDGDNAIDHWRAELQSASRACPPPAQTNVLQRRASPLADRAFLARARAALSDIATGLLEKVVLTRGVRFDAAQPIRVAPLLAALTQRHPECTIYAIGQHDQCLIGATPEQLVALDNGVAQADALAGTAWLSAATTNEQPGSLQLDDDKNNREQQLVVDAVRAALAPLCVSLDPPQVAEIMQLRGLQHLRTGVTGHVHKNVGLFDLIARLHPTPAVGGTPGAAARQWLSAHGDQRSSWYTGGVGWINRFGVGEVAVALRCARITGTQAELFAGAGIVAGSDPMQELAETEAKFGTMIDALQYALPLEEFCYTESEKTGTK